MQLQNFFLANSRDRQSRGQGWAPESECREIWPSEYLRDFAMRMAMNGMAVSSVRLRNDPSYTLQQLATAHAADDETLREMAMSLFRQFEGKQSGISCPVSCDVSIGCSPGRVWETGVTTLQNSHKEQPGEQP